MIHYIKEKNVNTQRKKSALNILKAFERQKSKPNYEEEEEKEVDYYQFAQLWLDIIQPHLLKARRQMINRKKVIDITSLLTYFKNNPLPDDTLEYILKNIPSTSAIETKIVSCILGVREPDTPCA
jgi:hypothetical protein